MKFDFFGAIPDRDVTRLMTLLEFIGDGPVGQKGYVSPEYFFWDKSLGEYPAVEPLQRELRLLGNVLVADKYRANKADRYCGHVVEIQIAKCGIVADFSMVENLNLADTRQLHGSSISGLKRHYGSIAVDHLNLESLA
jgi:hypothetical protein